MRGKVGVLTENGVWMDAADANRWGRAGKGGHWGEQTNAETCSCGTRHVEAHWLRFLSGALTAYWCSEDGD